MWHLNAINHLKENLLYDQAWKSKYSWTNYDSVMKGMFCIVCKAYGKVPVQARGAWVTRPVSNWVKTIALLMHVWVWLVGVVSRRWVWLVGVGGIYGCGYWVWF